MTKKNFYWAFFPVITGKGEKSFDCINEKNFKKSVPIWYLQEIIRISETGV